jgi:hypothetical protein
VGDWLRRLRGAIGLGVSWAVGWVPSGAVVGLVLAVTLGAPSGMGGVVLRNAAVFGILGLAGCRPRARPCLARGASRTVRA